MTFNTSAIEIGKRMVKQLIASCSTLPKTKETREIVRKDCERLKKQLTDRGLL